LIDVLFLGQLSAADAEPPLVGEPGLVFAVIGQAVVGLGIRVGHEDKGVLPAAHLHKVLGGLQVVVGPAVGQNLGELLVVVPPAGVEHRLGREEHTVEGDQFLGAILAHDGQLLGGNHQIVRSAAELRGCLIALQVAFAALLVVSFVPENSKIDRFLRHGKKD